MNASNVLSSLLPLFTTLLGGVIALMGSIVTTLSATKKERTVYLREKREAIYVSIAADIYKISGTIFDISEGMNKVGYDHKYAQDKLAEIYSPSSTLKSLDEFSGQLLLFVPKSIIVDVNDYMDSLPTSILEISDELSANVAAKSKALLKKMQKDLAGPANLF